MSIIQSGNGAHSASIVVAEGTRQVALAGTPTMAQAKAADIIFHRACLASAIANGVSTVQFSTALKELGTGGT
jgi:hypothetical protein